MTQDVIDPPEPSERSPLTLVIVLLGAAFFFVPAVAYALGERAEAIENRELVSLPSPGDGWSFFPDMTQWATDNLPLRNRAVRANESFIEAIFGQLPMTGGGGAGPLGGSGGDLEAVFPRVIRGEDGWLYFGADASKPCLAERPVEDTVDELDELRRVVESSGRTFVLVVAPDKSTIETDQLPSDYPGRDCSEARRAALWRELEAAAGGGDWLVDLREPLREARADDRVPIYRAHDTHWTPRGAAVFGQELLGRLQPGLTSMHDVVVSGTRTRSGDLAAMLGVEGDDTYSLYELDRAGVTLGYEGFPEPGAVPVRLTATSSSAPLFQPRTVLLGDSFLAASRPLVYPLFADLTVLHWLSASGSHEAISAAIRDAEVVVLELVEREVVGDGVLIAAPSMTAAIEAALR